MRRKKYVITKLRTGCLISFRKIQKHTPEMFCKKGGLIKTSQYSQDGRKTPVLEYLFNSEYCEIFKSTYFEEHLRTDATENPFMKLRKIKNIFIRGFNFNLKNKFFQHWHQKQVRMFVFISWLASSSWSLYLHTIFLWCDKKYFF